MSTPVVASSTTFSSVLWCAVLFLDPRRWLGTLFALVGITVSIITAVLPIWVVRSLSKPPPSIPPSHRPVHPPPSQRSPHKRSSSLPFQPYIASTPVQRRSIRIVDSDPHAVSNSSPSPQFYSFGSIFTSSATSTPSSSSSSSLNPSPPLVSSQLPIHLEIKQVFPEPVPVSDPAPVLFPSSSLPLPPPATSYNDIALQSLSCLDLATFPSSSSDRASLLCPKRHFRLSRLGFGKRRSTTDLKACKELAAIQPQLTDKKNGVSTEGRQGIPATSTKRCTTVSNPTPPARHVLPPCSSPRRRFSIFVRDCPFPKDNETTPPISLSDVIPFESPISNNSEHIGAASSTSAIASPSVPRAPSSPSSLLSSLPSLVPTQAPPVRPTRTDPYKTFGVPVPGSERARAFFKADKEMRAERMKRRRSEHNGGDKDDARVDGNGKGKDLALDVAAGRARAAGPEGQVDEFGTLVALEQTPAKVRPRSSGALPRRGFDIERVQEVQKSQHEKRRTFPSATHLPRPPSKLRESFGLWECKSTSPKDRGYVSDTGVPSLTYTSM